ncbi:MAG TPA: FAD-dependent oxidoreductase [Polyangiaceae bacterium]|nr:FAD-dependent oxidoreductase [Polyangiaceae bacterium]
MALLRRRESVRPLSIPPRAATGPGTSRLRPRGVTQRSPCQKHCIAGNDVRGVIALIAQHERLGLSLEAAFDQAFYRFVETSPFPATMGRICPHRCEENCSRNAQDGGVSVGAIERFVGDWAIARGLPLPGPEASRQEAGPIAVVGAGPAGLTCAYHLVRRGYRVTVHDSSPRPGGLLRHAVPPYRLPRPVLDAEITRLLALGVELRSRSTIGKDVTLDDLRRTHAAVFVAVGAPNSRPATVPGADGPGVYLGARFLREAVRGQTPAVGREIVVVGGGATAIDAARVAVRLTRGGAHVRLVRQENERVSSELEEAIAEGVEVELLTTVAEVLRGPDGAVRAVRTQRVTLGSQTPSGFPELLPVPDSDRELAADTVVFALGQEPDWARLGLDPSAPFAPEPGGDPSRCLLWSGGDANRPGLAAEAIAQGRQAAAAIDAALRQVPLPEPVAVRDVAPERLKPACFEGKPRLVPRLTSIATRLADPWSEVALDHDAAAIVAEASRCYSCGDCSGCERCWMYCTPGCMKRSPDGRPGHYFEINLDLCDGCKKCAEECPCGFLEMI